MILNVVVRLHFGQINLIKENLYILEAIHGYSSHTHISYHSLYKTRKDGLTWETGRSNIIGERYSFIICENVPLSES